jgi:hypothetical protein
MKLHVFRALRIVILRVRCLVIVRLIVLGLVGGAMWAQSQPLREASSGALMGGVMPAFYDGYLYACVPDAIVNLFAPDGHNLATFAIQGRGNAKVNVLSVAIAPDQTLAVGWVDFPSAGIDIRDTSGNLVRTIREGTFPRIFRLVRTIRCGVWVGNMTLIPPG